MTALTHLFFDLHGTLIDAREALPPQYRAALGRFMAGRYGGDPADWAAANARIVADWDSYYADLDFGGDDSLAQMREGQTRTLRALFRLVGLPYPPPEEMAQLVTDHHFAVTSQCDALYLDAHAALTALHDLPLTLGVVSHAMHGHAEGLLVGGGVRNWFAGPLVTPDVTGQYMKDAAFLRVALGQTGVVASVCALVDDDPQAVAAALELGMRAVYIDRRGMADTADSGGIVLPSLAELPALVRAWLKGSD